MFQANGRAEKPKQKIKASNEQTCKNCKKKVKVKKIFGEEIKCPSCGELL